MKKLVLSLAILGLFLTPAMAGIVYIEGPAGPVAPGGGQFDVSVYAEDFSDPAFGGFQIAIDYMQGGVESNAFKVALGGGSTFQSHKVIWNDTYFPEIFGLGIARDTVGFASVENEYDPVTGDILGPKAKPIYGKMWLVTITYDYTADAAGLYTLEANADDTEFSDTYAEHADFTVVPGTVNIVPEPATLALLGLGLAGLIRYRRKK